MSPMTVKVRRYAVPMSPAKTCPRFTPIRIGSGWGASAMRRAARRRRPSSSSSVTGTPVMRMTLPPLASMSEARKVTDSESAASWTVRTTVSSAAAVRSGPSEASRSSTPWNLMKATLARRCSDSPPRCREPGAQRGGDARGDRGGGHGTRWNGPGPTVDHVAPPQQATLALGVTDGARRQAVRRLRADHDLAGVGRLLHAGGGRGVRPGDQELVVGGTDAHEVKGAAVDPDRHPEVDPPDRGGKGPGLAQGGAHGDRPLRGHGGMVVAGEGQEQGVPTELQERAALGVRRPRASARTRGSGLR